MTARGALTALMMVGLGLACDPGIPIENRVLTTACGSCIFEMEGAVNCPFAVEIDGEHYLVQGAVPQDHLSHAPDGICMMPRKARVDGVLRDGKLIASRFELLPVDDPSGGPLPVRDHDHDHVDHDH